MKPVGIWVVACSKQGDFTKWGKDGDTEFPYDNDDEACETAYHLSMNNILCGDTFYILHVFSNGQIKQFLFDLDEYRPINP